MIELSMKELNKVLDEIKRRNQELKDKGEKPTYKADVDTIEKIYKELKGE